MLDLLSSIKYPESSVCPISMSSRLSAATALWFLERFHLHLHALAQIVGRIHDYFAVFNQPVEHLELRAEIAPDPNGLPVNAIAFRYRRDLRPFGAK